MGRIQAPAFKLKPPGKRQRKPQEFKFKAWKPLPGQLYFPELIDNGGESGGVHLARGRAAIPR
jgi:hypothetical protein